MGYLEKKLKVLNKRQAEQVDSWEASGFASTILSATGTGKSFSAMKAIVRAYEKGLIKEGANILFLAETKERKVAFETVEFKKFYNAYRINLPEKFNFHFRCYQSRSVKYDKYDMLIADEIDFGLTASYHKFILFEGPKIGFTATLPACLSVFRDELDFTMLNKIRQSKSDTEKKKISKLANKGQLLEMHMPVSYEYDTDTAVEDGALAPYETYYVEHELDYKTKNIRLWKKQNVMVSEGACYQIKNRILEDKDAAPGFKRVVSRQLVDLLYTLPSKADKIYKILRLTKKPNVVFNPRLSLLQKIPDVTVATPENVDIIHKYYSTKIQSIGSSRRFERGITLPNATNCFVMSPMKNSYHFEQMRGRVLRYDYEDKLARIFVLVTQGTFEEKWAEVMRNVYNSNGNVVRTTLKNLKTLRL